jgi:hypothetical protein
MTPIEPMVTATTSVLGFVTGALAGVSVLATWGRIRRWLR